MNTHSVHVVTIPKAQQRNFPQPPPRFDQWVGLPDATGQRHTITELSNWATTSAKRKRDLWSAYIIEEGAGQAAGTAIPLVRTRPAGHATCCGPCSQHGHACQSFGKAVIGLTGCPVTFKCDWCLVYNLDCLFDHALRTQRVVFRRLARSDEGMEYSE